MIQPFLLAFRKQIRNQSVAHIMGKSPEDVARFDVAAGDEREALEADHRVAAPVGEPVIAGDDSAHLVAGGARPRRLLSPPGRRNDELIRREHELRGDVLTGFRHGLGQQAPAPIALGVERPFRREGVHRFE